MSYLRPMGAAPPAVPQTPVAMAIPGYSILPAASAPVESSSTFRTIATIGVIGTVGYLVYRHMKKKGAAAPGATP